MWRDADIEARDFKSNALIARGCARSIDWLLKGAESFALRALATALRVWRDCGGMPEGTDEIFTIRLLAHPVNAENQDELRRPSHKCDIRAARRRRQGRSPEGRAQREP